MQLYDIFTVCTLSIRYTDNSSEIILTDFVTRMPVYITDTFKAETDAYIKMYIDKFDKLPTLIGLSGYFVHDSETIYAVQLTDMQIFNLQLTNCYLVKNDNGGVILVDENTNMQVVFNIESNDQYVFINNIVKTACENDEFDFSINGDDRLTCIGNLVDTEESVLNYMFNDAFFINTPQMVTYQLYVATHNVQEEE